MLDYVSDYVKERKAFGEPISNRQAVAFTVANIAIELDGLRLATYRAAGRVDQGLEFSREVALARRLCADRGMAIGSDGVQMLGGHGYVKEHPVERWYRDLRAAGLMEGACSSESDDQPRDPQEIRRAGQPSPTRWRPRSSGPTRASTTPPSTSTPRSSTCWPR